MIKYFYFIICSCIFYLIIFFICRFIKRQITDENYGTSLELNNISSFLYFSDNLL